MGNHYHLLVETPKANLAKGMRQLNGVYAQTFNRRHRRDGHLFQGRYGARLVQADEHLLAVVRYIVRNPLRAGICTRLDDWPWSSHAATIGKRPPGFLTSERLLSFLGESRSSARASYLALVESEEKPPRPQHPLLEGDDSFIALHLARVDPSPEHPRASRARPSRRRGSRSTSYWCAQRTLPRSQMPIANTATACVRSPRTSAAGSPPSIAASAARSESGGRNRRMTAAIPAFSSLALRPVPERRVAGTPGWNVEDLTPFLHRGATRGPAPTASATRS